MDLPKKVKIVEVGPRDGLQNEAMNIPTLDKIEFINRLANTGLSVIEATSFVSPDWIPQMADSGAVFQGINKPKNIEFPALIPNIQGLEAAQQVGITSIGIFTAATESFSQKNTNCSMAESMQRCEQVINTAKAANIKIRGYISCVLGCPYEGEVAANTVAQIAKQLFDLGCDEISLGDTIGIGTPGKACAMVESVARYVPINCLAAHFHDTYGQALANIYAVMQLGISIIDSSVAGLGGCPYAKGSSGNVATEDVVYMLQGLDIETGIDLDALLAVGCYICDLLKRENHSKVALAKGAALCEN